MNSLPPHLPHQHQGPCACLALPCRYLENHPVPFLDALLHSLSPSQDITQPPSLLYNSDQNTNTQLFLLSQNCESYNSPFSNCLISVFLYSETL